jgi:predicted phosphoadenosine phosphosulfate sulfurtransferase
MKLNKKQHVDKDCYSLSLERMEYIFDTFDQVGISFSGGKDSTVCMNLALEVATAKKKLPVTVFTFDEEAIPPDTVEYLDRVSKRDDVKFLWYCLPIEHRNACSTKQPYWYPWAPEDKDKWVRDLPATAITTPLVAKRCGIPGQSGKIFDPRKGSVAMVMGIRTQESLTRFSHIANKKGDRAWIMPPGDMYPYTRNVYPIYDWATEDVWLAPELKGWDYNRAYEKQTLAGIPLSVQRCSPPYGEQPIRGLYKYKVCWPELWAKMVDRVHGAATAARYANTDLYGCSVKADDLPEGTTWKDLTLNRLQQLDPRSRAEAAKAIQSCITNHKNRGGGPTIPDVEPDPLTGHSWKNLFIAAKVGGDKFGRQTQKMTNNAIRARKKNGIFK